VAEGSIVRRDGKALVWRVGTDGRLALVPVQLGERDARSGEWPLRGGLAEGDVILRNPGSTLVPGQRSERARSALTPAAAPTASAASAAR
jgi:membrane fusion protein, multidrug efflux system